MSWNRKSDDYEEGYIDAEGDGEIFSRLKEEKEAERKQREKIKDILRLVEEPRGLKYNKFSLNADIKTYQQLLDAGWSKEVIIRTYLELITSEYWKEQRKENKYPAMNTVEYHLRNKNPQ